MNGPAHYREAERALRHMNSAELGTPAETSYLLEAIAHGVLALAAAVDTLDAAEGPNGGSATGRPSDDAVAWEQALTGGAE